jgi:hypothetical protein
MFRNHRSRWTVAMVVVVLLLAALPAAAGQTAKTRGPEARWGRIVTQVLAWLGGGLIISPQSSSYIDPNGQH